MTEPNSNSPRQMLNGVVQLPVRSRIQPNMRGDSMPATANAAISVAVMSGWRRGSSWKYHHHRAAQKADKMPSTTNERGQDNHTIRKATIAAAAPAPRRPAAWVMPTAEPRDAVEVQLDNARVAAGKVAPSPLPSSKRTAKSDTIPPTAPVAIVVVDHASPQTV